MTLDLLERTATSNSQGEESMQVPVSPDAARVLQDTHAVTPMNSTSSSAESETLSLFIANIDALLETLDILNDAELMASIQRGLQESEEGKGEDLDDVLADLGW